MTTSTRILHRPRNFQWYWNSRSSEKANEEWMEYTDVENEIIEDAYRENKSQVEIDGDRIVSLKYNVHYNKVDEQKQRPIKREGYHSSNTHLREDRFSLPITLSSTSSTTSDTRDQFLRLIESVDGPDFPQTYLDYELKNQSKTLADIIEDAACGILKEGTILNKIHEAEWLAEQLRSVKPFANDNNIKIDSWSIGIPDEIGEICVFLYTKECYWYKLINFVLRNPQCITYEQVKTLGPFCFLLTKYLSYKQTRRSLLDVYRGVTLTDEQREEYMKKDQVLYFPSFTSTSINREKAEQFGNTLFIIYLDECVASIPGTDVSRMSDFPDEEEFLLWPATKFLFDKYEYDSVKKKHLIYLYSAPSSTKT